MSSFQVIKTLKILSERIHGNRIHAQMLAFLAVCTVKCLSVSTIVSDCRYLLVYNINFPNNFLFFQFVFLSNKNCDHISTSILYTFLNRFDDCDYNVAINVRIYEQSKWTVNGNKIWNSEILFQAFLLLTLLSMMNCAVHQVLKISLKIVLLISLSAIYFAVAIVQGFQINNLYGERYVDLNDNHLFRVFTHERKQLEICFL